MKQVSTSQSDDRPGLYAPERFDAAQESLETIQDSSDQKSMESEKLIFGQNTPTKKPTSWNSKNGSKYLSSDFSSMAIFGLLVLLAASRFEGILISVLQTGDVYGWGFKIALTAAAIVGFWVTIFNRESHSKVVRAGAVLITVMLISTSSMIGYSVLSGSGRYPAIHSSSRILYGFHENLVLTVCGTEKYSGTHNNHVPMWEHSPLHYKDLRVDLACSVKLLAFMRRSFFLWVGLPLLLCLWGLISIIAKPYKRRQNPKNTTTFVVTILLCVFLYSMTMPNFKANPQGLEYYSEKALKLDSNEFLLPGSNIDKFESSTSSGLPSAVLKLSGVAPEDLTIKDLDSRSINGQILTELTSAIKLPVGGYLITANKPGHLPYSFWLNLKDDHRKEINLLRNRKGDENILLYRPPKNWISMSLQNTQTKVVCSIGRTNPFCPTARYDLYLGVLYIKPSKTWVFLQNKFHIRSFANRRVLEDAIPTSEPQEDETEVKSRTEASKTMQEVNLVATDAELLVKRFTEESLGLTWTILHWIGHGYFIIADDANGNIAKQVHTEQFDTDLGVVSFYRDDNQDSQFVGRVVFGTGKSIQIDTVLFNRFRDEVSAEHDNLLGASVVFENGFSIDGTFTNIKEATFFVKHSLKLNTLIKSIDTSGTPYTATHSVCNECYKKVTRPYHVAKSMSPLEQVLVNVQDLFRQNSLQKPEEKFINLVEVVSEHTIEVLDKHYEVNPLKLGKFLVHSWNHIPQDFIVDVHRIKYTILRPLVDYIGLPRGYVFPLTSEEIKILIDNKNALKLPIFKALMPNDKENQRNVQTHTANGQEIPEFDSLQLKAYFLNPSQEEFFKYKVEPAVYQPYHGHKSVLIPHHCLEKLYFNDVPLFVQQALTPAHEIWPSVDFELHGMPRRVYLNVPLASEILHSDIHEHASMKEKLKECGSRLGKIYEPKKSLFHSKYLHPPFVIIVSRLYRSPRRIGQLFKLLGPAAFERIRAYDLPKRYGFTQIVMDDGIYWMNLKIIAELVEHDRLFRKWADGREELSSVDIHIIRETVKSMASNWPEDRFREAYIANQDQFTVESSLAIKDDGPTISEFFKVDESETANDPSEVKIEELLRTQDFTVLSDPEMAKQIEEIQRQREIESQAQKDKVDALEEEDEEHQRQMDETFKEFVKRHPNDTDYYSEGKSWIDANIRVDETWDQVAARVPDDAELSRIIKNIGLLKAEQVGYLVAVFKNKVSFRIDADSVAHGQQMFLIDGVPSVQVDDYLYRLDVDKINALHALKDKTIHHAIVIIMTKDLAKVDENGKEALYQASECETTDYEWPLMQKLDKYSILRRKLTSEQQAAEDEAARIAAEAALETKKQAEVEKERIKREAEEEMERAKREAKEEEEKIKREAEEKKQAEIAEKARIAAEIVEAKRRQEEEKKAEEEWKKQEAENEKARLEALKRAAERGRIEAEQAKKKAEEEEKARLVAEKAEEEKRKREEKEAELRLKQEEAEAKKKAEEEEKARIKEEKEVERQRKQAIKDAKRQAQKDEEARIEALRLAEKKRKQEVERARIKALKEEAARQKAAKEVLKNTTALVNATINIDAKPPKVDISMHAPRDGCLGMLYKGDCWGEYNGLTALQDGTLLDFKCIGMYSFTASRCNGSVIGVRRECKLDETGHCLESYYLETFGEANGTLYDGVMTGSTSYDEALGQDSIIHVTCNGTYNGTHCDGKVDFTIQYGSMTGRGSCKGGLGETYCKSGLLYAVGNTAYKLDGAQELDGMFIECQGMYDFKTQYCQIGWKQYTCFGDFVGDGDLQFCVGNTVEDSCTEYYGGTCDTSKTVCEDFFIGGECKPVVRSTSGKCVGYFSGEKSDICHGMFTVEEEECHGAMDMYTSVCTGLFKTLDGFCEGNARVKGRCEGKFTIVSDFNTYVCDGSFNMKTRVCRGRQKEFYADMVHQVCYGTSEIGSEIRNCQSDHISINSLSRLTPYAFKGSLQMVSAERKYTAVCQGLVRFYAEDRSILCVGEMKVEPFEGNPRAPFSCLIWNKNQCVPAMQEAKNIMIG